MYSAGRASEALKAAKQSAVQLNAKIDSIKDKKRKKDVLKELDEILTLCDNINKNNIKAIGFQQQIQYISSNINSLLFYPWHALDNCDDNDEPNTTLFEDPDGLPPLSIKQKKIFQDWARSKFALEVVNISMDNLGVETLCQDSLEDCSFVASLLSIYFYEKRHGVSFLKNNIFPQDAEGNLVESPTGKYWVRLNVNGTMRKVTVDDRLPITKNPKEHSLFVRSSSNPGLLWPAILEKAYLKLMGGYDFLGSYSASDTYALCSWIPEVVLINGYLQEPNASRTALWNKIYNPFQEGNLMICIGTGSISRAESEAYGLISDHDYTVMALKEIKNPNDGTIKRILQVKNPWLSEQSTSKLGSIQIPPNEAPEALHGSFWINFDSMCLRFSSLYLNWNPLLFKHQQTKNFLWSLTSIDYANKSRSYSSNPQFSISNNNSTENVVWLLLSRHITDRDSISGFVALHVYEADGNKVYLPEEYPCFRKGTFLNTLHYLLKIPIPAKTTYTVVVGANDITCKYSSLRFSLTSYSLLPVDFSKAPEAFAHKIALDGSWDSDNAGGSWANNTYLNNPRFLLVIKQPMSKLRLVLSSDSGNPINFRCYMSDDSKLRNFQNIKVICTSGEYRIGSTMARSVKNLKPGSYVIVVSMFEPNVSGTFTLTALGSSEFDLSPLPSINAGMFKRELEVHWAATSRKEIWFHVNFPCTSYFKTTTCKNVATTSPEETNQQQKYLSIQPSTSNSTSSSSSSQYRPHLRVSIFESPSNRLLYSSEEFTDNEFGVYLDGVQLYPDIKYICLVERMERGYGAFKVEVHSTSPVILHNE